MVLAVKCNDMYRSTGRVIAEAEQAPLCLCGTALVVVGCFAKSGMMYLITYIHGMKIVSTVHSETVLRTALPS